MPSSVTEASFCSALFCVFMARVRYYLIVMWKKGTLVNNSGEIFTLNFPAYGT
jgi:hypothetical protein